MELLGNNSKLLIHQVSEGAIVYFTLMKTTEQMVWYWNEVIKKGDRC